ncbi:MAG: pantetheine-phosphate adenylyltransferase [Thermofilaceae archaeon]
MALPNPKYRKLAVGGTFSLLHSGHRYLLRSTLNLGNEVLIGVTSDEYIREMNKNHPVEPYEVRALRIVRYCLRIAKPGQRIIVMPIDDFAGPVKYDPSIEALIATEETFTNALRIALARRGMPLEITVVEPVLDTDGEPISSTKIWNKLLSYT